MNKRLRTGFACLIALMLLAGCAPSGASSQHSTPSETLQTSAAQTTAEATQEPTPTQTAADFASLPLVRVASLQGPTGMGLVGLMQQNDRQETKNRYEFTLVGAPEEIVALLSSGSVDVAAIPTNLAASLYQATGGAQGEHGDVRLAAINTLGVLYILERGDSIQSVADLAGKTIHATGQGATPEYALNEILRKNDIDATVEYHGEHAELLTLAAAGEADIVMLPEPFVTNLLSKAPDMRIALDISKEWETASSARLAMGALAVNSEFSQERQAELDVFLSEYAQSVSFVNANTVDAAALIEQYGIMPSAAIAEKALPNCNIVLITGQEMKDAAIALYNVLYDANPKAVGGAMPDQYFYYIP